MAGKGARISQRGSQVKADDRLYGDKAFIGELQMDGLKIRTIVAGLSADIFQLAVVIIRARNHRVTQYRRGAMLMGNRSPPGSGNEIRLHIVKGCVKFNRDCPFDNHGRGDIKRVGEAHSGAAERPRP